jgi:hypothetical protein
MSKADGFLPATSITNTGRTGRREMTYGASRPGIAISAKALFRCWSLPTVGSRSPLPREQLFAFRGEHYGFLGVRLADFVPHARPLSESWDTVAMPTGLFRRAARPLDAMIAPLPAETVGGVADWHEMPANLQWEA